MLTPAAEPMSASQSSRHTHAEGAGPAKHCVQGFLSLDDPSRRRIRISSALYGAAPAIQPAVPGCLGLPCWSKAFGPPTDSPPMPPMSLGPLPPRLSNANDKYSCDATKTPTWVCIPGVMGCFGSLAPA